MPPLPLPELERWAEARHARATTSRNPLRPKKVTVAARLAPLKSPTKISPSSPPLGSFRADGGIRFFGQLGRRTRFAMTAVNRQLVLNSRPKGMLAPGDLQLKETAVPGLQDGQALARVKYLSIDPTMRVWMAADTYLPAVAIGEVMRAFGLAEIIESRHPDYQKGDRVMGLTGLQDYVIVDSSDKRSFQKVPKIPFVSDTAFLGVLGINGLTAFFGMEIAQPKKGETLVVSAAAGATGSIVGHIGKIHGCRVIGIAGTDQKCAWIVKDLGCDAAINYKHPDCKEK